jgi:hypothetical protein
MITEIRDIRETEHGTIVDVMYYGAVLPVSLSVEEAIHELVAFLMLGDECDWDRQPDIEMPVIDWDKIEEIPYDHIP